VDNVAWMDLGDCALVVNALEQPPLEQEVFAAIASTLGETPVRYLLNTRAHGDHVALSRAFQRRFGTEIVNNRHGAIAPEGRWFEGPGRRVLMLPMPGCHTRGLRGLDAPQSGAVRRGRLRYRWRPTAPRSAEPRAGYGAVIAPAVRPGVRSAGGSAPW